MGNGFLSIVFTQVEDMKGELITGPSLAELLDNLYDRLKDDEAVVLMVKKDCTLICTRQKGHGDHVLKKFTNFGFAGGSSHVSVEKAKELSYAIRTIADNLPEYCYQAIAGDKAALRQTTNHLFKVYSKKAERMKVKGKPAKEIAQVLGRHDQIKRYLDLNDDELVSSIDTLIIEVPKNPETFENLDELAAIGNKAVED